MSLNSLAGSATGHHHLVGTGSPLQHLLHNPLLLVGGEQLVLWHREQPALSTWSDNADADGDDDGCEGDHFDEQPALPT